jgi:hypothetical protein
MAEIDERCQAYLWPSKDTRCVKPDGHEGWHKGESGQCWILVNDDVDPATKSA